MIYFFIFKIGEKENVYAFNSKGVSTNKI